MTDPRNNSPETDRAECGDEQAARLWRLYEQGMAYQSTSGLARNLPTFVDFYEGRQWAPVTRATKNLPRPVINIIKMICRAKKSAVLATPVRLIYRAEDGRTDTDTFNAFAEYIAHEIGQDAIDRRAMEDGVVKGTYVYHYYWDPTARGRDGICEGGVRCELIDPLRIFFADPTECDEQKQKWILIASREDAADVRRACADPADAADVRPDEDAGGHYGRAEQEGSGLVTVLTRYFRRDGEVYCERATRTARVAAPFPLSPDVDGAAAALLHLSATGGEMPAGTEKIPQRAPVCRECEEAGRATLYPVVVGNYDRREHSIYGLGEVEGLIPNQKAVNFNLAMLLLNAQETAWGKYVVLPGALRGQAISNEPGQTLVDYSGSGNGIRRLSGQPNQSGPLQLVETIAQMTRSVTGVSELMTGEILGSGLSGAAIAQLQAQARAPVEELKNAYWLAKKKQGLVLAQFFRLFYAARVFPLTADGPAAPTGVFCGGDYRHATLDVAVEAVAGSSASAAGDINALDVLLAKNAISPETYIRAYPRDALSNRTELLRGIEEQKNGELSRLRAENAALRAALGVSAPADAETDPLGPKTGAATA